VASLSNNRDNAIGPWYVYANNAPSNANANNWGGRASTQMRIFSAESFREALLNHPLIKNASDISRKGCVSQSPLMKRGLVGGIILPLEETRCGMDARRLAA